MLIMDCHTHTAVSPDSDAAVSDMSRRAGELGLQAWAITDHIELCRWYPQEHYGTQPRNDEDFFDYAAKWEQAMQQNLSARDTSPENCTLISGIELGEPDADFSLAEKLYHDDRLDFVIASMHELRDKLDFYFLDYENEDVDALLEAYFTAELAVCRWGYFDVLGHITYPLRYIEGEAGIRVDMKKYKTYIAECFQAVIRNGRGIELNTSGYRQRYGKPFPEEELLRLYKDLGGRILSLGSDAHSPADLGGGILQGAALAKACGFGKACYFLRHEPHWIEL